MGTLEAFPLRAACLLHKPMLLWCTGAAVTIRLPPRNGVIDRHELKALLQSTDNGFQPVTLVRAWLAVHPCATPVPSRPVQRPHRPRCCHPRQDWMEDREVKEALQKYDWDGSGTSTSTSLRASSRTACSWRASWRSTSAPGRRACCPAHTSFHTAGAYEGV